VLERGVRINGLLAPLQVDAPPCSEKVAIPLHLKARTAWQSAWSGDLVDRAGESDVDGAGQVGWDAYVGGFSASPGRCHHPLVLRDRRKGGHTMTFTCRVLRRGSRCGQNR
jgi:hypothetical protein